MFTRSVYHLQSPRVRVAHVCVFVCGVFCVCVRVCVAAQLEILVQTHPLSNDFLHFALPFLTHRETLHRPRRLILSAGLPV